MNDTQRSEIRARLKAGTPGPWDIEFAGDGSEYNTEKWPQVLHGPASRMKWESPEATAEWGHSISSIDELSDADADLIAKAPTDIAALLEEVEQLRAIVLGVVKLDIDARDCGCEFETSRHNGEIIHSANCAFASAVQYAEGQE